LIWVVMDIPNTLVEPDEEAIRAKMGSFICKHIKKYFPNPYLHLQEYIIDNIFSVWSLWIPMLGVLILNTIILTAVRYIHGLWVYFHDLSIIQFQY
jgi:hypothetical protein